MIVRLLLTCLFICLLLFTKAQTGATFLNNGSDAITVTNGFMYIDSNCSETFDAVSAPAFSKNFKAVNLGQSLVQDDVNCYWVKFALHNNSGNNNEWMIDYDKWTTVEVYTGNGTTGFTKKITGHTVPYYQKDVKQANRNLINITLKPNETGEIYVKLITGYNYMQRPADLSCVVYAKASVVKHQKGILNIMYFFSGIYIVMLLYNFFVFYSTREKGYLYYLYIIFFSLFALWENTGYTIPLFRNITNFPSWITNLDVVTSALFGISILLFTRNFLNTKQSSPVTDKLFNIIIAALVVMLLPALIGHSFLATNISGLIGMVTSVVVLIASVRSYRQHYPSAGIFLLANSLFMASIFLYIFLSMSKQTQTFLFNFSISIGSATQIVLFSLALANRINILKKQNEESQQKIIGQLRLYGELQDKTKKELEQKVEERTRELKESQKQLLQQEKLASLGEVTAGVAHEIQNPLNFIKNFSELNEDLGKEMDEELIASNIEAAKEITAYMRQNTEKILLHGARLDAIVKGMLQHTRLNSGQTELTAINKLCEECVGLSYHGLRGRDKSFNATIVKNYDDAIGSVPVNAQDIGRVLLNLLNNAFYAVGEKQLVTKNAYEPIVTISTKKIAGAFQISICDNGNGIPQKILNKIFQPFFTTKPVGKGTGLGLSMSYQIVKEHNGQLTVNSEEGRFTEFIITIPL